MWARYGQTITVVCGAVVIVALVYGGFMLQRWFHWNMSYEDAVRATVKEMVRPEALK